MKVEKTPTRLKPGRLFAQLIVHENNVVKIFEYV